jgi:hypothetical protein
VFFWTDGLLSIFGRERGRREREGGQREGREKGTPKKKEKERRRGH